MKPLPREALEHVQRLPAWLRDVAANLYPGPEQEARARAEEAEQQRQRDGRRAQELSARLLRALDGAFGDAVKTALVSAMRQCAGKPTLEQLERMNRMINEAQKAATATRPANGRRPGR